MAKARTAGKAKVAKAVGPGGQTPGVELVLGSKAAILRKAKARKERAKVMAKAAKGRVKASKVKAKERKDRKETRIGAECGGSQDIGATSAPTVATPPW